MSVDVYVACAQEETSSVCDMFHPMAIKGVRQKRAAGGWHWQYLRVVGSFLCCGFACGLRY